MLCQQWLYPLACHRWRWRWLCWLPGPGALIETWAVISRVCCLLWYQGYGVCWDIKGSRNAGYWYGWYDTDQAQGVAAVAVSTRPHPHIIRGLDTSATHSHALWGSKVVFYQLTDKEPRREASDLSRLKTYPLIFCLARCGIPTLTNILQIDLNKCICIDECLLSAFN